ncbi:major facilitator superfamily domain-containing protein [Podospora aff. communis PSN243]|uniref:Major facilitator superfamily domain-containing protein n=1 Tax=Podospora aff. communis PSN243 TaxID=3040156 RepID=A0AAV9GUE0_9PEZI|nr:major facilitator superfamily domain-containing protein [Podospora aff. communis PSN243]
MFFTSKKKDTGEQPPSPPQSPPSSDTDTKDASSPPLEDTTVYPSGLKLALLIASVFVSLFLISLDRLIVATAIPAITNEFHSVNHIGWYGSAYLLTNAAFQLMFGKVYTFFSVRGTFLMSILLFEVGSAMCGAAPGSEVFIVARGIQGLGAAGIMAGSFTIIVYAVPLAKRPMYQGLVGAIFGISSVLGPLVGGAFTTRVTWRWCFYINLPFGAVAFAFVAILLKVPDRPETKIPLKDKILQLDLWGSAALLPGTVSLLLALQWGGADYEWSNGRIIALLTIAIALLIAFCLIQVYLPKTATIAPHIFRQRSIVAGVWCVLCNGSSMLMFIYFIPIWFQAIQASSAIDSGILLLPFCLPMVFATIFTGVLTTRIGYYTPFLLAGTCFMAVGAGLLTTLDVSTPQRLPIGYQVLYGFGAGMSLQAPNLAAQTVLPRKDAPVGLTLIMFVQLLGGAIFLSVGQNVLNNRLLEYLAPIPGFSISLLLNNGATTLIEVLGPAQKPAVLTAYNEALRWVFRVGLITICLGVFGALAMEWRNMKKPQEGSRGDAVEKVEGKAVEEGEGGKIEKGDVAEEKEEKK